ncbi:hypothetical protein [Microcoleus sp. PH2017_27_LUM_O_A]|uniref:hypothetical protein n=1 Tax=Microcoleus sp. PH2017_27_LUM_O_A TaxID=2798837 RepID=UPI0025FB8A66|nr:hypothetical protein [Microcoleus sp. PH2017_27_LUM_O_A]
MLRQLIRLRQVQLLHCRFYISQDAPPVNPKPGFFPRGMGGEKPGFYEFLRLVTRNIRRNAVSDV